MHLASRSLLDAFITCQVWRACACACDKDTPLSSSSLETTHTHIFSFPLCEITSSTTPTRSPEFWNAAMVIYEDRVIKRSNNTRQFIWVHPFPRSFYPEKDPLKNTSVLLCLTHSTIMICCNRQHHRAKGRLKSMVAGQPQTK